jgi:hypothetical protein
MKYVIDNKYQHAVYVEKYKIKYYIWTHDISKYHMTHATFCEVEILSDRETLRNEI